MNLYRVIISILTGIFCFTVETHHIENMKKEKVHRHPLSLSIAHAHISQDFQDGNRKSITEPSIISTTSIKNEKRGSFRRLDIFIIEILRLIFVNFTAT